MYDRKCPKSGHGVEREESRKEAPKFQGQVTESGRKISRGGRGKSAHTRCPKSWSSQGEMGKEWRGTVPRNAALREEM